MLVRWILWGLFVFWGQSTFASYYDFTDKTDLDYEKFQALINDYNLESVEDTLAALRDRYPSHFETYILMYKSRSLQESSYMAPRAILFDKSAKFVFSFNGGDAEHRGHNRIEIMQYRDDTARFEFREVVFSEGRAPKFSKANPRKCMVCHQSSERKGIDPRPNWDPYNTWPGAYGSLNGNMEVSTHDRSEMKKRNADPSLIVEAEKEKEMAAQFFEEVQESHPRYRFLNAESFDPHFTTEFTQFVSNLNARRVARIVMESLPSEVSEYLELPYRTLIHCAKLAVGEDHLKTVYELLKEERRGRWLSVWRYQRPKTDGEIRREALAILRSEGQWEHSETAIAKMESVVRLRNERAFRDSPSVVISEGIEGLFEPFGISTSDWSMDFQTGGSLAFRERFGVPGVTQGTFREGFESVYGKGTLNPKKLSCEELSAKSIEKIREFKETKTYADLLEAKNSQKRVTSRSLLNRCVKCHDSRDREIPYIPFDQPNVVAQLLNRPASLNPDRTLMEDLRYRLGDVATESERMPMGKVYSRAIRKQLVDYFDGLAPKDFESDEKNL